jgi:hypothetical protein
MASWISRSDGIRSGTTIFSASEASSGRDAKLHCMMTPWDLRHLNFHGVHRSGECHGGYHLRTSIGRRVMLSRLGLLGFSSISYVLLVCLNFDDLNQQPWLHSLWFSRVPSLDTQGENLRSDLYWLCFTVALITALF